MRRLPISLVAILALAASPVACKSDSSPGLLAPPGGGGPPAAQQDQGTQETGPATVDEGGSPATTKDPGGGTPPVGGTDDGSSTPPVSQDPGPTTPPTPAGCGSDSPAALAACADEARYSTDLELIADVRPPGSAHWQVAQDLCANRLAELGYAVSVESYGTGVNVVALKRGSSAPDEQLLISAHYDHIEGCEGADDNATGLAALLEVARLLADASFSRTLILACWDEEERGMVGSGVYARRAAERGDKILASVVFEMLGYVSEEPNSQEIPAGFDLVFPEAIKKVRDNESRGDFIFVAADESAQGFLERLENHAVTFELPLVGVAMASAMATSALAADLRRSDHAPFWDEGLPAMMLTDTANFRNPYYHCAAGPDVIEHLDSGFALKVIQTTVAAAAETLELR